MRDLREEVTVFIITVGEPSFTDAYEALTKQNCKFISETIRDVAPMSAAFQQMIDRCKTRYYVQVDADMVLHTDAISTLFDAIRQTGEAMVCYPLYDAHIDKEILGVKIYDHEVFRHYPYTDTQSCEMDQLARVRADGHAYSIKWGDAMVLGMHGTQYTPRGAFERYKDLIEKARTGNGNEWALELPSRFLARVVGSSASREDLWALLGALAGLTSDLSKPRGEKDFRKYAAMRDCGMIDAHLVAPPRYLVLGGGAKKYEKAIREMYPAILSVDAANVPMSDCRTPWTTLVVDGGGCISGCPRWTPRPEYGNVLQGREVWWTSAHLRGLRMSIAGVWERTPPCTRCKDCAILST